MRNTLFCLMACMLFILSGCYDRDVIDGKLGVSLPAVTNLNHTVSGESVTLSWNIPTNIPTEIETPLTVNIQIYKGSILILTQDLKNEPTSYLYKMDEPTKKYRFIVKMRGKTKVVKAEYSSDVYSLGQTITVN